jgi:hypothetical protein
MGLRRTLLFLLLSLVLNLTNLPAQTASTVGQWSSVMTWPTAKLGWVPTHAILLPNGKVLYAGSYGDGLTPHIFDPATGSVTLAAAPSFNIFCMGHTHLADGRVFIAGGHIDDYEGYAHASIYNPGTNTWTNTPDMNAGRWYPTTTSLANGDVLTISGTIHGPASNQIYNEVPQVYQASTNSWRTLSSAVYHVQLYPFMFLAPNGKVFLAGWNPDSRYLDTAGTGAWTRVASSLHGWRNYGSAVMYDAGKVMLIGGDGDGSRTVTNTTEVIDLNAATPAWQYAAPMHYPRRQHNSTLLPDGTVLVTGGSKAQGFDVASGAVYPASLPAPSIPPRYGIPLPTPGPWWRASPAIAAITRSRCCCPMAGYSRRAGRSTRKARRTAQTARFTRRLTCSRERGRPSRRRPPACLTDKPRSWERRARSRRSPGSGWER